VNPLDLVRAEPGPAFTVTLDGRAIEVLPGRTVAAALWAEGVTSWRGTRDTGRPRGVFCGIGVCFDCLVTIDGIVNLRACLEPVRVGMKIKRQQDPGYTHAR